MADGISITDLEQKAEVTDNDNFAVDNGAITNKVTAKQIKDYMGPTYVKKSGDTMTGPLIVPDVSSGSNDNTVINSKWANGLFVKKAGDTMTGALKVSSPEFSANDTTVPNTAWVRALITGKTVVKDYITERFSDENGNWYELYASGWIKQGGIGVYTGLVGEQTVTLLKPMANANYSLMPLMVSKRGGCDQFPVLTSVTTTNFKFTVVNAIAGVAPLFTWRAEGYKAQGA